MKLKYRMLLAVVILFVLIGIYYWLSGVLGINASVWEIAASVFFGGYLAAMALLYKALSKLEMNE